MRSLFEPAIKLMNSMRFPHKISLAIFFFFLPSLVLYSLFTGMREEIKIIKREQRGLAYLLEVKAFFWHLPQHRGMSMAYLRGKKEFEPQIRQMQLRLEEDIKRLDTATNLYGQDLGGANRWALIKKAYETLQKEMWTISAEESFERHTTIIEMVIDWIDEIANRSGLESDPDLMTHMLADTLTDHIPNLAEYAGRARAKATVAAAKREITLEERRELVILYGLLRSELEGIKKNLKSASLIDPLFDSRLSPFVKKIETKGCPFLTALNDQIINTERIVVSSDEIYDLATHCIDGFFEIFDETAAVLGIHFENKLAKMQMHYYGVMAAALAVLFGLLYFTVGFYLSFKDSLDQIIQASHKIEKGDFKARVKLATKDELLVIATAFNEMAAKLDQYVSFLKGYNHAIDVSTIVSKTDKKGTITYVNNPFCEVTGYSQEELIGQNHRILRDPGTPKEFYKAMWDTILAKKIWHGIVKNRRKDGTIFYADSTIVPILNENGDISEFLAIRKDITELVQKKEELTRQLYTDALTNLPNRNRLLLDLAATSKPYLLLVNIDSFGEINDFYGHEIGDRVLVALKERILSLLPQGTVLYRIYADEFALLLDGGRPLDDTEYKLAQRLSKQIEERGFLVDDNELDIGVTMGLVLGDRMEKLGLKNPGELLLAADMALRAARKKKLPFLILDQADVIKKEFEYNIQWTRRLREAIKEERIIPYFQGIFNLASRSIEPRFMPMVETKTGKLEKFEVLMRIVETDGRVISPFAFLDVAKRAKLYTHLTRIIIVKAFEAFRNKKCECSINISVDDILDEKTVAFLKEKIIEYGMQGRVVFEILETEGIEKFEEVSRFIKDVKILGCKIAIDDFGSGYSNFDYILKLDVDYIKIDGSLIKNIHSDPNTQAIVETIVGFARKLGILTVAEFVHSKEVYDKVVSLGIDYAQGYYLAEPSDQISSKEGS